MAGDVVKENVVARLQAYVHENAREERDPLPVPPFTLFLHRTNTESGESFAVPDLPNLDASPDTVATLLQAFREQDRTPSVRYIHEFAPALADALTLAGFAEAWRTPFLVCTSDTLHASPSIPGLAFAMQSSDSSLEEVRAGWNVNAQGFDPAAPPGTDEEIEAFRQTLHTSRAFTAHLNGEPVAAGMWTEVRDGVTELVGIATLHAFQRRGIAAALTAHMAAAAFNQGIELVFLGAASPEAQRVYERIGFEGVGTFVGYALENSEPSPRLML